MGCAWLSIHAMIMPKKREISGIGDFQSSVLENNCERLLVYFVYKLLNYQISEINYSFSLSNVNSLFNIFLDFF